MAWFFSNTLVFLIIVKWPILLSLIFSYFFLAELIRKNTSLASLAPKTVRKLVNCHIFCLVAIPCMIHLILFENSRLVVFIIWRSRQLCMNCKGCSIIILIMVKFDPCFLILYVLSKERLLLWCSLSVSSYQYKVYIIIT